MSLRSEVILVFLVVAPVAYAFVLVVVLSLSRELESGKENDHGNKHN